jgi:hypothetical protein
VSYYASAIRGKDIASVGPFRRHGDALRAAELLRGYVNAHNAGHDWAVGTHRRRAEHRPGAANAKLDLTVGADGFIDPAAIAV